jgi:hypothetical protein
MIAWLIERDDLEGGLHYFASAEHRNKHWWTTNPNLAEKFETEEDARLCCLEGDRFGPLRVRQHKWIGGKA